MDQGKVRVLKFDLRYYRTSMQRKTDRVKIIFFTRKILGSHLLNESYLDFVVKFS